MSKLILFTNYYPYFKGEEYLETEIEYLSAEFDEIILFPTLLSDKMERTREVPKNVSVYPIYYNNTYLDKFKSMARAIFSHDKAMHTRVKNDAGMNPIRRLYDYYFEARTKEVFEEVSKILQTLSVSNDVVIYSYWMHATAKVAVEVKKHVFNNNVKFILTRAHRYDVEVTASPINFLPEREYLLENIDKIYCVSDNSKQYLQETYPKFKEKVETRRLGTATRSAAAISLPRPFRLVSCSLLRKVKNVDKIADALEIIEKRGDVQVEWIHFGNGPEFENIKKQVSEKLKSTKVELPGYVSNSELMEWYGKYNPSMFINVSSSEGIPVSIMEAMSFGIPVIATDVGGNGEIVSHEKNGWLLPSKVTPLEIADAITHLYNLDSDNFEAYADSAYKTWQREYSSEKNYPSFAVSAK